MSYTNFQVGEKFPLPIKNQGDGGLFQIDSNGCMFILQLSHTDVIAVEAFRTGELEIGLYEENGLLFFLYKIDGIFKDGWGDSPLGIHLLPPGLKPCIADLDDPVIHFYLVDTTLQILLAQRAVSITDDFHKILQTKVQEQLESSITPGRYIKLLQDIWQRQSSKAMSEQALIKQKVELNIPSPPKSIH